MKTNGVLWDRGCHVSASGWRWLPWLDLRAARSRDVMIYTVLRGAPINGRSEPNRAPEPRSGLGKWLASSARPGDDGRYPTEMLSPIR